MTPTSRTFIFDSADADLFETYNDVEATFFSSTDSDSSLSESSTTTSTGSSDDDSSDNSSSAVSNRWHRRARAGQKRGVENEPDPGYGREPKRADENEDDNEDDLYSRSVPGTFPEGPAGGHSLPLYNSQLANSKPSLPETQPNAAALLSIPQDNNNKRSRSNSVNSFYSAYSMNTLSSQKTRDSAKSSKSLRRADPLHGLKSLVRRRKNTSDSDSDGKERPVDASNQSGPRFESRGSTHKTNYSSKILVDDDYDGDDDDDDDVKYDDDDIIEIQVGNSGNNNPPGIMMPAAAARRPKSKPLKPTHPSKSKDQESTKKLDTKSAESDESRPVVIEEPVESEIRKRHRRQHRHTAGANDNGAAMDETSSRRRTRRSKDGHGLKRTMSHRLYSTSMTSASAARRRAGWDPGIDIRTTQVMLQSVGSTVTIVDYNATRYRVVQTEVRPEHHDENEDAFQVFDANGRPVPPNTDKPTANADFVYHLANRPAWSSVRWISVNGLSWEAISAISKQFQLHRLAIEDMVEIPQRTKADMYPSHIFCVLPMHKLMYYKPAAAAEAENAKNDEAAGSDGGPPDPVVSKAKSITTFMMPEWMSERVEKVWDAVAGFRKSLAHHPNELDEQIPGSYPREWDNGSASNHHHHHHQTTGDSVRRNSGSRHGARQSEDNGRRSRRNSLSYTAPLSSLSYIGHRVNANASKILRLHNSDDSSSDDSSSDDSDSDAHKSVARLLSKQQDKTIYDWSNTYTRNSKHKIPLFIEEKHPLATYRRAVGVEQVSLFLTNKQTVISFFERSAPDIERPLLARLASQSTMLRESCDPSMLLQAIIDIIVDQVQPIITAYRRRFTELEVAAMVTPTMAHTQDLHLMAAELSLLRNTIFPISTLVQSLRDHNDQAANKSKIPAHASTVKPASPPQSKPLPAQQPNMNSFFVAPVGNRNGAVDGNGTPQRQVSKYSLYEGPDKPAPVRDFASLTAATEPSTHNSSSSLAGLSKPGAASFVMATNAASPAATQISGLAKLYLGDIGDHLFSYTQDIDMMRENTQNMIEMIFNTIYYKSGESIAQLNLVTVVFLPLTFWASYYGMNLDPFPDLVNGPELFWKISVPFTAGLLLLVMANQTYSMCLRMLRSLRRRWHKRQHRMEKRLKKKMKRKEE